MGPNVLNKMKIFETRSIMGRNNTNEIAQSFQYI